MKNFISILIAAALMIAPALSAKPKGDWNAVKALAYQVVAIKTNTGETFYGQVRSTDDSGITVRIAGDDDYTAQEINFQRSEIAQVWRATLRFGKRNIAKGAWIGAGAGFGLSLLTWHLQSTRDSRDSAVANGGLIVCGTSAGALVGKFWRKNHQKDELVYST